MHVVFNVVISVECVFSREYECCCCSEWNNLSVMLVTSVAVNVPVVEII